MERHHSWSPFEDMPSPLSTDVEEIVTYMRHAASTSILPSDACIDLGDDREDASSSDDRERLLFTTRTDSSADSSCLPT